MGGKIFLFIFSALLFPCLFLLAIIPSSGILQTKTQPVSFESFIRSYRFHVPKTYTSTQQMPLVVVIHSYGMNDLLMELTSGFSHKADQENFIVVYPLGIPDTTGGKRGFNAQICCGSALQENHDDVNFVRSIIKDMQGKYTIDPHRIYVVGYSNGGMLAYKIAMEDPAEIAGVGVVSGALGTSGDNLVSNNPSDKPIPIIILHGTDDQTIPYNGGNSHDYGMAFVATKDAVAYWVKTNKCDPSSAGNGIITDVYQKELYVDCARGADVSFIHVIGGGHTWFGGFQDFFKNLTSRGVNATDETWSFFSQHAKE